MVTSARRKRDPVVFRGSVVGAARRIVLEQNFGALSMRKIADAIGCSVGTLYLHFENRDAIAIALVRECLEELLTYLEPCAAVRDPLERCMAIGRAYVRFGVERPQSYRLVFMENPAFSDVLAEPAADPSDPGRRALDVLLRAVAELDAAGRLASGDTESVANAMWAGLHGIVSLRLVCPAVLPERIEPTAELILAGFATGLVRRA